MAEKKYTGYYQGLLGGYLLEAKALMPKYDEMVLEGVRTLKLTSPQRILDIGAGIGNVERVMKRHLGDVEIVALEPSLDMAYAAQHTTAELEGIVLLAKTIEDFNPEEPFDAVYTNSVLHNVPYERKADVLTKIHGILRPGGAFVWGDYIRSGNRKKMLQNIAFRIQYALQSGEASDRFIYQTLLKESMEDTPLTVSESLGLLHDTGFVDEEVVWIHDTFGVFYAAKKLEEEEEEEDKALAEIVESLARNIDNLRGLTDEEREELRRVINDPRFYNQQGMKNKYTESKK